MTDKGGNTIIYILLTISILFVSFFSILILRMKNKKQLHYAVLAATTSVIMWDLVIVFHLYFKDTKFNYFFELLYFLGPITVSVAVLFLGLSFAYYEIVFTRKWLVLFILPVISAIMLFTNQFHHLFFTTFSLIPSQQDFGVFFTWHSIVSYLYVGVGLAYLTIFSIKNYGFYSKQSFLILLGILVSLVADSFSTLKIYDWPTYVENIAFTFTIACFMLAMVKYDFLNIVPIANKIILDSLTDSYVVTNDDNEIIDYNKAFAELFSKVQVFKRRDNILQLFQKYHFDSSKTAFQDSIENSVKLRKKTSFDLPKEINGEVFHHRVEIIPIHKRNSHIGTVIIMRDITESKRHLDQITMLNHRLQDLAIKDGLTKTYNRYFFEERLQQEINRVLKQKNYEQNNFNNQINGFGLVIFDIDFFKIYNDTNGHLAGDELLQVLVNVIKSVLFPTDILCRYGGEEFAIICCETSMEGTGVVAEKIRKAVANYEFKDQENQPGGKITISVGAAYYSTANMSKEDLIKKADGNLYLSKNKGRNMTTFQ